MKIFTITFLLLALTFQCATAQSKAVQTSAKTSSNWQKIDSLMNYGLPKSALKEVNAIFSKSLQTKNSNEYLKSSIYRFRLRAQTENITLDDLVEEMEMSLNNLWEPARQITHHYLAYVYIEYLRTAKWRLLSNKQVSTGENKMTKMSYQELSDKITEHFFAALRNKKLLQSEPVEKYELLLEKNLSKLPSRPTLYDLIILDASKTLLSGDLFTLPAENTYLFNDSLLLSNLDDFLTLQIPEEQAESPEAKSLELLKEWLIFKKRDNNKEALYDADLNRLLWMNNKYFEEDAFKLMDQALTHLAEQSKSTPIQSSVLYNQAFLYNQLPHNEHPQAKVKAWQLAEKAIKNHPKSEGAKQAKNLQKIISRPSINALGEEKTPLNTPYTYLLSYSNIPKVYVYLYALDQPDFTNINSNGYAFFKKELIKKTPIKKESVQLPDFKDYLEHSAELCMELPNKSGHYALLFTLQPFNGQLNESDIYQILKFQATNLSYLIQNSGENNQLITVVNSVSGKPIEGVKVSTYNSAYGAIGAKLIKHPTTNSKGESELNLKSSNRYYNIFLSKEDDQYLTEQRWWTYRRTTTKNTMQQRTFIFTDRMIYSPGQTIHFKAVAMESDGDSAQAIAHKVVQIKLLDSNYKEIANQQLTTNEYGSISGSFILPNQVLTGTFYLKVDNEDRAISVEEYKRPKMTVTFYPFTEVKTVGDSITIKALAKSYTDVSIQNAKVAWKVEKNFLFWRWTPLRKTHIASGTAQTNELGEVSITFKTSVDKKLSEHTLYTYHITVDVTASNGETASNTKTVTLGNKAVKAQINLLPLTLNPSDEGVPALIEINNFSNEKVGGKIKYVISKLKNRDIPDSYRYWQKPDTILCAAPSFFTSKDDDWKSYPVESVIASDSLWIEGAKKIMLPSQQSGTFRLDVITEQPLGKTDTTSTSFQIVKSKDYNYNLNDPITLLVEEKEAKPGDTLHIMVGSAFNNATIFLNISYDSKTLFSSTKTTQKEWYHTSYIVPKNVTGNIYIQALLVKNNRSYDLQKEVSIQNPAKKLYLSLSSFRDKTTPGSNEKWQLTLNNGNNQPAKAEILALMYDASLDALNPNTLFMNPFNNYKSPNNWSSTGFKTIFGNGKHTQYLLYLEPESYPTFFWTNQYYFSSNRGYSNLRLKSASGGALAVIESQEELLIVSDSNVDMAFDKAAIKTETAPTPQNPSIVTDVEVRKNLQETAFFFPFLQSDSLGKANFSFTMPESLTQWRFMALAHTKDGNSTTTEEMIITSKELMVVPNLPRVVRHGDKLFFNTTIVNNSSTNLQGNAYLTVKDVVTKKELPLTQLSWWANKGKSTTIKWPINIPDDVHLLEVTIGASAETLSDGETHFIPVLSSKTLVTETMPITLNNKGKHSFEMKELTSGKKGKFEQFTVTYTANAAWEMLDALPWIIERPYESNDQIFNRYFAASVAQQILKQHPNIKEVLQAWALIPHNKNALTSALERNPELKSTILTATPWLTQANNDSNRRKRLAEMTNETTINTILYTAIRQLENNQLSDGSWPWFSGTYTSPHTTMEIITGFGYLYKIGISFSNDNKEVVNKSLRWLHTYLEKEKTQIRKDDSLQHIPYHIIKGLYALTFFDNEVQRHPFWINRLKKNIPTSNIQLQAIVATILHRIGEHQLTGRIMQSLEENLIDGDHQTSYYKNAHLPYWYHSPIETHIAALEAFREIGTNNLYIQPMENWLIAQKRTQSWRTTKATVAAIYSLTQSKQPYFSSPQNDVIKVGSTTIQPTSEISGLGYFKQTWTKEQIHPKMGHLVIDKKNNTPSWASLHLQYFKESKEIKEGGFLKVSNHFFKRVIVNGAESWEKIDDQTKLVTGDRLLVQISVESPQALDFVHISSPRAAGFEPTKNLSGYRWSTIGYYQSVNNAGIDFFIDHLPKGRITLHYETIATMEGIVVNGPTEASCFYAPEFAGYGSAQIIKVTEE